MRGAYDSGHGRLHRFGRQRHPRELVAGASYVEARKEHGENELLDALVADGPSVKQYDSDQELEQHGLERLSEAVRVLEQKAGRGELHGYKRFTLDVAGNVAKAHKEKIASVTPEEREAIERIATSLNPPST